MPTVDGNHVSYGSGAFYSARIDYTATRYETEIKVDWTLHVYASGALSDVNNSAGADGSVGSASYGAKTYSFSSGGGTLTYISGTYWADRLTYWYSIWETFWVEGLADGSGGGARSTAQFELWIDPLASPPDEPNSPTISAISSSGATINMVLPEDNGADITDTAFVVYNAASGGSVVWSDSSFDPDTSANATGLTRKTNYWATVAAENSSGWSGYSSRTPFTTLPEPPVLVGTPAATNIARTSFVVPTATISDTGGESPSQYRVQVNTSATDVGAAVITQASWAPITVGARLPLTTYYYRVSAYNSGGWGPWTAWAQVTTLDAAPNEPAAPTISTISETSAYVSWAAPALNSATLDNYLVRVCTGNDPNAYVKTYTLPPSVTGVSVSGLTKGTWYNVFVKALATPTDSGWSPARTFKTSGSWSTLRPWFKSGGVWYRALVWKNDGGTWKRVYTGLNVAGTWRRELD